MAIFVRRNKTADGDKSSKKEQSSMFRSRKDVASPKQDQSEIVVTSIPEPQTSYVPPTTRNKTQRRSSSVHASSMQIATPTTPRAAKDGDHFPRVDIQAISDSPTLGHPRTLRSSNERGYFPTNYSDSGYESAETTFLPHAFSRSGALNDKLPRFDSDARSTKSTKSAKSSLFHRKQAQKGTCPEPTSPLSSQQALVHTGQIREGNPPLASNPQDPGLPSLSILAGIKVNTKGRLLDEEGDIIGELFEGDLLDCVRQKANASGEVLDDYGRVVGRVRTVPRSAGTPSVYAASPSSAPQRHAPHGAGDAAPISPLLLPTESDHHRASPSSQAARQGQDQPVPAHLELETDLLREARGGSEASIGALPAFDVLGKSIPISKEPAAGQDEQTSTLVYETSSSPDNLPPKSEKPISSPSVTFANPECSSRDITLQGRPKVPKRAESERMAPSFTRSQSRMSLNSILANRAPDEGRSNYTPSLFSYKGEIPAADGPQGSASLRSQPFSAYSSPRQGPPALNVKIAHVSSGAGQRRVQITDDLMAMPLTRPALGSSSSMSSAYKRSYLNSTDNTPNESPDGTERSVSDDGRSPMMYGSSGSSPYVGQSVHTQSNATTRTYFTHAGRVAVRAGEETTTPPPAVSAPKPVESAPPKETEKKRGRFGLFGKKQ